VGVATGLAIVELLRPVAGDHVILVLLEQPPEMVLESCDDCPWQMLVVDAADVTVKGEGVPGTVKVKVVVHGPACPL
jgi:hypothetical protein